MDPFYNAAFVASSELNDLSQNASNVVSRVLYLKTKIPISGPFSFFYFPPKRLKFTHFTRGRGIKYLPIIVLIVIYAFNRDI